MANTWGELSWNSGQWGEQNDATVALTGIQLTSQLGEEDSFNTTGWGRYAWGELAWGAPYQNAIASVTGSQINLSLNNVGLSTEINEGWGRLTWGENAWGIAGDVIVTGIGLSSNIQSGSVTAEAEVTTTGQQLSLTVENVTAFGLAQVPVSGQQLTNSLGTVDAEPDAMATGIQMSSSVGTVDAYNLTGWGRLTFGSEVWGATGYWAFAETTGIQLSANLGTAVLDANTLVDLTGNNLVVSEGTADPSPDATVTGIGLSASVALGSVVEADANISLTGQELTLSLGTAILDAITFAYPSGIQLSSVVASAVAGASAEAYPTGNQVNISLGNSLSQVWTIVDTGTSVAYTEVSTGSSVTWNNIDTAA